MRTLAIYPGSFDPPTLGHLDVIERANRLFDRLIVAVGRNSAKDPLFTVEERMLALRQSVAHLPSVEVDSFSGLLVDYARSKEARSLVRGLRATADFEYEFQMAMINRRLEGDIETVFLMTSWEHSYLSSSIVREVALLDGAYEEFVPEPVAKLMGDALKRRAESSKL
jgi:pantetheine-phosphate adenylyltransferase